MFQKSPKNFKEVQIIDHLKKIPTELPDQNFGQNCSKKAKKFQKSPKNFKKNRKG